MVLKKIVLTLILMLSITYCSIIFNPFDNTTFNIHTPKYLRTSQKNFTQFTVPIVPGGLTVKDMQACNKLNISFPLNGLAVLLIVGGGCDVEVHGEVGKRAGASAVFLLGGFTPDYLAAVKYTDNRYNQSTPILMIGTDDFTKIVGEITKNALANSSLPVLVTVSEDKNIWIDLTGGGGLIFFQVFTEIIFVGTLFFGIRGQVLFTMEQGLKPTAAQLCLFFCNLALICNIIFVLDMFSIRRWYVYGLYLVTNFLAICFTNISSMSLAYFFQELLLQKKISYPGLSYFKIPFILTSIALIGIYISFCVTYITFTFTDAGQRATFFVPAAIFFMIIIFFSIGGFSIIRSMKKFKKKAIGRVTVTVLFSNLGMLIIAISFIVFGVISPLNMNQLVAYMIIVVLAQIMIIVPQVFTFKHPSFSGLKSSSNNNKPNSTIMGNTSKLKDEISEREFNDTDNSTRLNEIN